MLRMNLFDILFANYVTAYLTVAHYYRLALLGFKV
jgi:hypothetical protein